MSDLEGNFDVIILGTGVVESITAAALSKAGVKVAHLDNNAYYGGDEASLTLDELAKWADNRSVPYDGSGQLTSYLAAQRTRFTSVSRSSAIPDHSRHYSVSLAPSLITSVGPLISSLIASGVSRYGGYRLLERVGIYSRSEGLQNVPGSKEDVFRSSLSLLEKRRLMRFLVFASGDFEGSKELQGQEKTPFPDFLKVKFSLSQQMIDAIVYALAFCPSNADPALPALTRLRSYLRSSGRYGASPFLVGHYGGLGEIAQGFCRVSAVNGGVYILDRKIDGITTPSSASSDKFVVQLNDFPEPLTADVLIASPDQLPESLNPPPVQGSKQPAIARCIAIIDKPIPFPPLPSSGVPEKVTEETDAMAEPATPSEAPAGLPPVDTSVIIFPPNSVDGGSTSKAAQAFVTGSGTLSAPQGKYAVYLSLPLVDGEDPHLLLKPYLDTISSITGIAEPQFKVTYVQRSYSGQQPASTSAQSPVLVSSPPPHGLADISDSASSAAESLFFRAVEILRSKNPQAWTTEGEEAGSGGDFFRELKVPMWPPLEGPQEDEGGDEW
ncbi:GDP dissociation inhibitor-domain-containing protein [Gloeopeniophorella convolvens]|nr:GDP dissociation inhibitor-domain-containing protein [Gloeopeniophorella convolvens]